MTAGDRHLLIDEMESKGLSRRSACRWSGYSRAVARYRLRRPEQEAQWLGADAQRSQGKLPFLPERIGAWWEREAKIDVLAVSRVERQALVGECKWSMKPVGTNVLEQLKQKAQAISVEFPQLHYALFSRLGFTPALESQAHDEGLALYQLDEIVRAG